MNAVNCAIQLNCTNFQLNFIKLDLLMNSNCCKTRGVLYLFIPAMSIRNDPFAQTNAWLCDC